MSPFNAYRSSKLRRAKDGRFKLWIGGQGPGDYNQAGLKIHIGKEFKRQHGHAASPGDVVRKKILNGQFHKGAEWWIMGREGWQNAGTKQNRPTAAEIKEILKTGRKIRRR
jgi:hypothetical protein